MSTPIIRTSIECAIRFNGRDYPASLVVEYTNEDPDDAFEHRRLAWTGIAPSLNAAIFETLRGRRETLREIDVQYVIEGRVVDGFVHVDHYRTGADVLEKESRTIQIEIGDLIEEVLREREEEALNA